MARIKEVLLISEKYASELKWRMNEFCKSKNVQNIAITIDEIGYYNAFIMVGTDEGKKKK